MVSTSALPEKRWAFHVVLPVVRPWSQCHIRTTYAQTGAPVPPEEASDQQVPLATKDKKTEKTKQKHSAPPEHGWLVFTLSTQTPLVRINKSEACNAIAPL